MYSIDGQILRPLQTITLQHYMHESIFDARTALIVLMLKGEKLKKISMLMIAPDSKVHGANMGPTWVLSALNGPHFGPMNLAIRGWSDTIRISACGETLAALRVLYATKSSIIGPLITRWCYTASSNITTGSIEKQLMKGLEFARRKLPALSHRRVVIANPPLLTLHPF